MLSNTALTDDQLQTFKDDGFLIVRGLFNAEQIAMISEWSDEMLARPEESGKHWVYHEKSLNEDNAELVSRIENISPFHDGFRDLTEALRGAVRRLFGEEAVLFKEKINFKMPGGAGFKPHQDSQAGWDIYTDFFISVLVSIDAATIENGCLELCAGHHKRGLFETWKPLSEEDRQGMNFRPAPTEPGDVVVFNDTRVIPARLFGQKASGGKVEMLLERGADHRKATRVDGWDALQWAVNTSVIDNAKNCDREATIRLLKPLLEGALEGVGAASNVGSYSLER